MSLVFLALISLSPHTVIPFIDKGDPKRTTTHVGPAVGNMIGTRLLLGAGRIVSSHLLSPPISASI